MKSLRNLLTNPWFIFAVAVYVAALLVLRRRPEFSLSETLIELAIFRFAFPLLALLTTRRAKRLAIDVDPTRTEMLVLGSYILALSLYLAFGPQAIDSWLPQDWIASERSDSSSSSARSCWFLLHFLLQSSVGHFDLH